MGGGGDDFSHSIHIAKEVGPQSTKGINSRHKGNCFPGCKPRGCIVYYV